MSLGPPLVWAAGKGIFRYSARIDLGIKWTLCKGDLDSVKKLLEEDPSRVNAEKVCIFAYSLRVVLRFCDRIFELL